MVVICSLSCERSSLSLKACSPRSSILARCANFSCWRAITRSRLSLRSCCGNFTAFCPAAIPQEHAKPRRRAHAGLISAKTNQVFHHAAKIPTHAEIADQDVVFVDLKTSRRRLLSRPWIDVSDIDLQPIED